MRSKNKPALNTIRALQAEIINASKTAKPITTDGALYSLIQKQIKSSSASLDEFRNAKRDDLVEKEQLHLDVLKSYADEIPTVSETEIDSLVASVVEGLEEGKRNFNSVMGRVMGGSKGRPLDLEYVTKKVQEAITDTALDEIGPEKTRLAFRILRMCPHSSNFLQRVGYSRADAGTSQT
ncbi:hypothetical protein TW65_00601 [Stemphylium lycopersici]|nr:hypothetical protein TW65_00601 [Stemphylium lycopersici]